MLCQLFVRDADQFGTTSTYFLVIEVSDDLLIDLVTIAVSVTAVNLPPTIVPAVFSIPEGSPVNTVVGSEPDAVGEQGHREMGMNMKRWLSVLPSHACPLLMLALLSDPKGFSILTLVVLTRASRSLPPPRPKLAMSMTPPQPLLFIFANRASSTVAHVRSSQQCSHRTLSLSHSSP